MCKDLQLSERHRERRERRWRFYRLRAGSHKHEDGGTDIRPILRSSRKRVDPRPSVFPMPHEVQAFITPIGLAAGAVRARGLQDTEDAKVFAKRYPYAGAHAA